MDKKLNRKCIVNPRTGHAVVEGSKIYKKLDASAKTLQAAVKSKLAKKPDPPPKPSPPPQKPKMKPKPSPKVDDDNWFLPYVRKEASQILQAVARRQAVKNKK